MERMSEEEFMERAKADKVTFYKHKRGGRIEDIDFVVHENVYLVRSQDTVAVFEENRVIVYPSERLYEFEVSGRAMELVKDRYLLVAAVEEKQVRDSKAMLKD